MRETVRSMRAYLMFAGGLAVVLGLRDTSEVMKLPGSLLPTSWMLVLWFASISRVLLGLGYLAAGLVLPAALKTGAGWIRAMLLLGILVLVADAALVAGVSGMEVGQAEVTRSVIGLAITAYLLANLRRLAAEATANQPPPARVV